MSDWPEAEDIDWNHALDGIECTRYVGAVTIEPNPRIDMQYSVRLVTQILRDPHFRWGFVRAIRYLHGIEEAAIIEWRAASLASNPFA